eukprot:gene12715-15958_t
MIESAIEYAIYSDVDRTYAIENTEYENTLDASEQGLTVRIRSTTDPSFKLTVLFSTNITQLRGVSARVVDSDDPSRMVLSVGLSMDPLRLVIGLSSAGSADCITLMVFLVRRSVAAQDGTIPRGVLEGYATSSGPSSMPPRDCSAWTV